MAKRQNEESASRPPARVRYFELEGSDETIQKALQTFERMRGPGIAPPQPTKRLPSATTPPAEPSLFDDQNDEQVEVAGRDEDVTTEEKLTDRRKRGEGASVDRNAGITAAGDVNFYPDGKQSLKDFFAEKAPSKDLDRCLVFCFYLQEIAMLPKFGAGHVLACFNNTEEPIPKDLAGTLRNIKEGKKGSKAWLRFDDLEDIHVTTNGLNRVRFELGKKATPSDNAGK